MFICESCLAMFDIPNIGTDEEPNSCPNCGSWDYARAKKCKACGEYTLFELCEGCKGRFAQAVRGFINLYAKELGISRDDVIDLIEENLDYEPTYTVTAEGIGAE